MMQPTVEQPAPVVETIRMTFDSVEEKSGGKSLGYQILYHLMIEGKSTKTNRHLAITHGQRLQWRLFGVDAPSSEANKPQLFFRTVRVGPTPIGSDGQKTSQNPVWPFEEEADDLVLGFPAALFKFDTQTASWFTRALTVKADRHKLRPITIQPPHPRGKNIPLRYLYTVQVTVPDNLLPPDLRFSFPVGVPLTYREDPEIYVDEC